MLMTTMKTVLCLCLASLVASVEPPAPAVTAVDYTHEGDELQGFVSEPEGTTGLLPAVVFIPYVQSLLL